MKANNLPIVRGLQFLDLLSKDEEFCQALGQVNMAAGRLKNSLIKYLGNDAPKDLIGATLNQLIGLMDQQGDFSKEFPVLKDTYNQYHEITLNLPALFSGMIDITLLEREGLVKDDVHYFLEKASQICENLNAFARIILKRCEKSKGGHASD